MARRCSALASAALRRFVDNQLANKKTTRVLEAAFNPEWAADYMRRCGAGGGKQAGGVVGAVLSQQGWCEPQGPCTFVLTLLSVNAWCSGVARPRYCCQLCDILLQESRGLTFLSLHICVLGPTQVIGAAYDQRWTPGLKVQQ